MATLLANGDRVTVYDRFYFGRELLSDLQREYSDRLAFVQADVRAIEPEVFEGVDAVVDLAGLSNDPAADLDPSLTEAVNYAGSVRVGHAAEVAGVPKMVFASSCSVYGAGSGLSLTEESPLNPVSLYAKCKARAEAELIELSRSSTMSVTALRFATVFGLSYRMRFDLAVNMMSRCAYVDGKIRVSGGGQQWRPFVHVKDIASGVLRVLECPEERVRSRVFNLGSDDNNFQMRTLAHRIRDRIPGSTVEMVPSDPDTRNYNVNFRRINEELDWKPTHTIEDGVDEVIEALSSGRLDPDCRLWYTLKQYVFLTEVERLYPQIAMDGHILTHP